MIHSVCSWSDASFSSGHIKVHDGSVITGREMGIFLSNGAAAEVVENRLGPTATHVSLIPSETLL